MPEQIKKISVVTEVNGHKEFKTILDTTKLIEQGVIQQEIAKTSAAAVTSPIGLEYGTNVYFHKNGSFAQCTIQTPGQDTFKFVKDSNSEQFKDGDTYTLANKNTKSTNIIPAGYRTPIAVTAPLFRLGEIVGSITLGSITTGNTVKIEIKEDCPLDSLRAGVMIYLSNG